MPESAAVLVNTNTKHNDTMTVRIPESVQNDYETRTRLGSSGVLQPLNAELLTQVAAAVQSFNRAFTERMVFGLVIETCSQALAGCIARALAVSETGRRWLPEEARDDPSLTIRQLGSAVEICGTRRKTTSRLRLVPFRHGHVPEDLIDRLKSAHELAVAVLRHTAEKQALVGQKTTVCSTCRSPKLVHDTGRGEIACGDCGTVLVQRAVYDGNSYRNFEGEESKDHHGHAPDPLLPSVANLETRVSGIVDRKLAEGIARVEAAAGTDPRNDAHVTRQWYKSAHARSAFRDIDLIGSELGLPPAIVRNAHRYFAYYRAAQERIVYEDVLWAALVAATRNASYTGTSLFGESRAGSSGGAAGNEGNEGSEIETSEMRAARFTAGKVAAGLMCIYCSSEFPARQLCDVHTCPDMPATVRSVKLETIRKRKLASTKTCAAERVAATFLSFSADRPSVKRKLEF